METLIIIALILAGLLLFAVEVFLVPGITLAGIASGISLLYAICYAFHSVGTQAGFITLAVEAVGIIGITIWFMRSKTLDKIALKKNITSKVDRSAEEKVKVGDIGVTTTRLALIGYAEINGDIVEVKSSDGFLNEKTPIIVDRIADGVLLVERLKQ